MSKSSEGQDGGGAAAATDGGISSKQAEQIEIKCIDIEAAKAAEGQAAEVTAATLKRTLGESEDRILLRRTNSDCRKLSATSHLTKLQRKASAVEKEDDTISVTTTTSDVNSNDDSLSIVSRISQIVVEQEGKLQLGGCSSSDGETQKCRSNHDRFRNSPTGSPGSSGGAKNVRVRAAATSTASNDLPSGSAPQRPIPELKVFTTDTQMVENHMNCDENDEADNIDKVQATQVWQQQHSQQQQQRQQQQRQHQQPTNDSNSSRRMRAKSVVEPSGESAIIRRNESSGYLPERGDLRDLEINRKLSQYASFSKGSNKAALLRDRSNTAGSGDTQSGLLDTGGAGAGGQLMLNIKRSTWTLSEFDQTFHKSNDKSETSSIGDPFEKAGDANDHISSDGNGNLGTSIGMSPMMMMMMSTSAAAAAAAAAASCSASPQTVVAASRIGGPNMQEKQHNNLLIRASKNAINLSQVELTPAGLNRAAALDGARFISPSSLGPANMMMMMMKGNNRRNSEVSSSLSCDSYCIRPLAGKAFASRRKRRGSQACDDYGDNDDEQNGRGCLSSCFNLDTFGQYIPILHWLPNYNRSLIWGDLMAGLAVAVLNISTSLSAAVVAQTDLGAAFRASIVNTFVYALLCSSRHTSFGSWSIMSQMLFISVRRAMSDELILNRLNIGPSGQGVWDEAEYERWHLNIIIMYTFLIGLTQLVGGLLNLGNILASFIPEALCSSMIAATAFTMAIGQLAHMCGTSNKVLWAIERNTTELWAADLKNPPVDITDLFAGLFRWIQQIALLIKYHEQINLVCVLISAGSVIVLFLNQCVIQKQLEKQFKRKIFIPFEMILLIVMITLSYSLGLAEYYNVATCGAININFEIPTLPNLKLIRELWFESATTAIISYSMVYIMAKTYSNKLNYEVDCNQELIACGAGNLIGGLFDALPATASFSRTAGQVEAGGNTQMASIINCIVLIVLCKLFGHHVAALPTCVMSATLFYGFVRMMTRFMEVFNYWRVCKVDFAIWLVTFVSILTLDLINGFVYGFIFSIFTMLYRAQNRRCYMLGCIGSADVYVPLDKYHLAQEIDGIKIFQFCGPIHYVCADLFERLLRRRSRVDVKMITKYIAEKEIVKFNPRDINLPGHIILDFSMISFIDSAGIKTIRKIIEDYDRVNVTVLLASLASHVATVIKSEPLLWETYKDRFYITLADAVHCAVRDTRLQQTAAGNGELDKNGMI